jgi:hypothetical protein
MIAGPASPELERFAREALGCHCPAEVFERVEDNRDPLPGLPEIRRRISVGGRLLIYVAEIPGGADRAASVSQRIGDWVSAGLAERDRRGMSRLRLVVGLDALEPESVAAIETAFARLPGLAAVGSEDPRLHLHCLPRSAFAGI